MPDSSPNNDQLPVILVVDDDDASRSLLLETVDRRYGHDYDVTAESSAAAAMRRLEDLHGSGRLVATILAAHWMTGETGASLLARARRLYPTHDASPPRSQIARPREPGRRAGSCLGE